MASPEENPKSERKKMIAAIALGFVALVTLWFAFFSGSTPKASSPAANVRNSNGGTPSRSTSAQGTGEGTTPRSQASLPGDEVPTLPPSPIPSDDTSPPPVPEASRNIFAFY